jgi:predicted Zn-dependent protease
LETAHRKIERTYLKLVLGSLVGFVAFIFLCWGGCHLYDHAQSRHLVRRAAGYLSGGNLRDAMLSARRAMQLEESVGALRIMAEIAEQANDRTALEWRRQVLKLAPNSNEDRLALASSALQFNETQEAEKTLASLGDDQAETAASHAIRARIAEAKNDVSAAEEHWTRASDLDPQNKSYRIRLALTKLKSKDSAAQEAGRSVLESLRTDETQRALATRALITDAIGRQEDGQKIRTLARELQDYPEAVFADRLLYLEILRQLRDPEYAACLTKIEKDAPARPTDLAALLTWMNANQMSLVAIDYAKPLPENVLKTWPVPRLLAEAYSKIGDWLTLERITKDANWGQFDFLRRAFLARALRAQSKSVAAEREWAGAAKSAAAQYESLGLLMRIVSEWGWKDETVDLLWQLTKYPEAQRDALKTLYQQYAKAEDTQGLYRVLVRVAEIDPADLKVQNNLAQISLLLHADVARARQLATDLFHKEPSNPAYSSTYAFSLYERGDFKGALRVMDTLPPDQLNDPAIAAYYGIILAGVGDREKARRYLEIGKKAHLLREEKALLERAEPNLK